MLLLKKQKTQVPSPGARFILYDKLDKRDYWYW